MYHTEERKYDHTPMKREEAKYFSRDFDAT